MNLRTLVALLIVITMASLGRAEGLLKLRGQWAPFLERLGKDEFLAVEHTLGGTLTDEKPDLLIYESAGQNIWTSLLVTRVSGGGYRLDMVIDPESDSKQTRKSIKLPADVAARLLAVMQLCLTKQLYPPTGRAYLYPTNQGGFLGGYWINLQIDKSTAVAGVVPRERCIWNDSVIPFLEVMHHLKRLAETGDTLSNSLAEFDLSIHRLQSSYPDKR